MQKIAVKNLCLMMLLILTSCNYQKYYTKGDYTFYKANYQLSNNTLLRTDGVYVLHHTKNNTKQVYKFYNSGQANLHLDVNNTVKTDEDYVSLFNEKLKHNNPKQATLFESYYNLEQNRLVVQHRSAPRKQFYYNYFLIEKDQLRLISSTHTGNGKIADKHYNSNYSATYKFIPTKGTYLAPNW